MAEAGAKRVSRCRLDTAFSRNICISLNDEIVRNRQRRINTAIS